MAKTPFPPKAAAAKGKPPAAKGKNPFPPKGAVPPAAAAPMPAFKKGGAVKAGRGC